MPEYLAPAVYVEEVDTGSKPIEGVSTSTTGMVGVAERGPVNIPILVTSAGEYRRWFGDLLNPRDFGEHRHLPHAVDGFFQNGGKRSYITRIVPDEASLATRVLFEQQATTPTTSMLVGRALVNDMTIVALEALPVLDVAVPAPSGNLQLRIGDAGDADYVEATGAAPVTPVVTLPLSQPLSRNFAGTVTVEDKGQALFVGAPVATFTIASGVIVNGMTVTASATPVAGQIVQVGTAGNSELLTIMTVTANGTDFDLVFTSNLQFNTHVVGETGVVFAAAPLATFTLNEEAPIGATILRVNAAATIAAGQLVQIGANGDEELLVVRSVAGTAANLTITLEAPTQVPHPNGAAGSVFTMWTPAAGGTTTIRPTQAGDGLLTGLGATIAAGNVVVIRAPAPSTHFEVRRIANLRRVSLGVEAYGRYPAGTRIEHFTTADTAATPDALTLPVAAGAASIEMDDRTGVAAGTLLRIGGALDPAVEYVRVRDVPNPAPPGWPAGAADPGRVVLDWPLARPHASGPIVAAQTLTAIAVETAALALETHAGSAHLLFSNLGATWPPAVIPAGSLLRVTTPDGAIYHHRMDSAGTTSFQQLDLTTPITQPHGLSSSVTTASPLLDVVALDAGAWGNRLAIAVRRQTPAVVRTTVRTRTGGAIRLTASTGVEIGTVLQAFDAAGVPDPTLFKVETIDRQNGYELTFNAAPPVIAAPGARIESVEFQVDVFLFRQPDPAQPTRDDQVIDSESFRSLSLDPRHSRYIHRIIGTTWTPGAAGDLDDDGRPLRRVDRRSEGESQYIRVRDRAAGPPPDQTVLQSIRVGPDMLLDVLPDGRTRPSRLRLSRGNDQIPMLIDDDYIGFDAAEPINRTGLQTMRNIEDISIVACPGRTTAPIQNALINHCEIMRYRFAVLDGAPPPGDTIADVQVQRAQYDTKYAAIYHPWLMIPHPYPSAPGAVEEYAIPPSGHMLGIYARTDIERGVHKAPANEVVRGVIGLRRTLNKEHHDILNPFPVNINVIRDFRPNNRGIRVYGGRVITSDSDWKYVNVRRLLIFIEASIDRGLQWVVFEPNAEPLWARVRRSITNFLTLVWRNGALEGTDVEEAFFVKCDRTTMTQTDIDSGRLIVQVGVAPVKPAEFVIVRIGLWTAHAEE